MVFGKPNYENTSSSTGNQKLDLDHGVYRQYSKVAKHLIKVKEKSDVDWDQPPPVPCSCGFHDLPTIYLHTRSAGSRADGKR